MPQEAFLAIDLGAESGRGMVGCLHGSRLTLHEVHRFQHHPCSFPDGLHWDLTGIWQHILVSIRKAAEWARAGGITLRSVGVDAWGVDYALVDPSGELLTLPRCYRDDRHNIGFERACSVVQPESIYAQTGIQLMPINTLYQLVGMQNAQPGLVDRAEHLLFLSDLFHYLLTGVATNELTMASTSQMLDVRTGECAGDLLTKLGLPDRFLRSCVEPGSVVGTLRPELCAQVGADPDLQVVAPASHDTASAVAAVAAREGTNWCYLSSGTWSLLGAELKAPCINSAARDAGFTNELGVGGTVRFLRNITGLWLLQECRRGFAEDWEGYDYSRLTEFAAQSEPFRTVIDTNHTPFLAPGDMPQKICDFARSTGQPLPESPGQFVRCCLESLALAYRTTHAKLEQVLGQSFEVTHIVGGGSRNTLLNQMTSDATEREVIAGPAEATAIGNLLTQALGGGVNDLSHARSVVRTSFEQTLYHPADGALWAEAAERLEGYSGTTIGSGR